MDALRVKYLGKKGALTAVLKQMGGLSAEERPIIGQLANEVREALTTALEQEQKRIEKAALDARLELEQVDVTIPGKPVELGHRHPMYIALDEIKDIFVGMGFQVLDGPEVELAEYNFDKLNAPEGHPSRDWSDTFYFDQDSRVMLRSQTSPMQVRAMETMPLPIRIIAPGRVYRKEMCIRDRIKIFRRGGNQRAPFPLRRSGSFPAPGPSRHCPPGAPGPLRWKDRGGWAVWRRRLPG